MELLEGNFNIFHVEEEEDETFHIALYGLLLQNKMLVYFKEEEEEEEEGDKDDTSVGMHAWCQGGAREAGGMSIVVHKCQPNGG